MMLQWDNAQAYYAAHFLSKSKDHPVTDVQMASMICSRSIQTVFSEQPKAFPEGYHVPEVQTLNVVRHALNKTF